MSQQNRYKSGGNNLRLTVPASESEGWTIVLMDRSSRFIWCLECGKKEEPLFKRQYVFAENYPPVQVLMFLNS